MVEAFLEGVIHGIMKAVKCHENPIPLQVNLSGMSGAKGKLAFNTFTTFTGPFAVSTHWMCHHGIQLAFDQKCASVDV